MRQTLRLQGEVTDFFTIGDVAQALGRSPATVRRWERLGILPKARYRKPGRDHRGERRLYSRQQLDDLSRAALREGLHRRRNGRGGVSIAFWHDARAALRSPLPDTSLGTSEGECG